MAVLQCKINSAVDLAKCPNQHYVALDLFKVTLRAKLFAKRYHTTIHCRTN